MDMLVANLTNPSARLLRALLFVALERAGASVTLDLVGLLLTKRLREVKEVVLRAWVASMPDLESNTLVHPKPRKPSEDDEDYDEEEDESEKAKPLTWPDVWASCVSRDGLGLTEKKWLSMTPRQVATLHKLRIERMQREEMLVGILASTTANFSHNSPKKPLKAEEFMLHKLPEKPFKPVTGDQIMRMMKNARRQAERMAD